MFEDLPSSDGEVVIRNALNYEEFSFLGYNAV
jgi:hypothetical protein